MTDGDLCACGCGETITRWSVTGYKGGHYMRSSGARLRMRKAQTGKKRVFSNEHRKNLSLAFLGKKPSDKCVKMAHLNMVGERSHNWKGGLSFIPYCHKFNEKLKEAVRERDNRTCQLCYRTESENLVLWRERLSVHHVHYDKENCYPDLLSLCHRCNVIVNSNRDYWEHECMEILNNRCLLNWEI